MNSPRRNSVSRAKKSPTQSPSPKRNSGKTIVDIEFDDYQLQITFISLPGMNYHSYKACLHYIGTDTNLNEYIQKLRSGQLCILNLEVEISDDTLTGSIDIDDKHVFKYELPYNIYIKNYYNDTRKYGLDKFLQTNKLKGIPQIILCIILSTALKNKLINVKSKIALNASGEIEGKDMIYLIKHYESLGMKVSFPKYLREGLMDQNVVMDGIVSDVLETCKKKDSRIFEAIKKIIKKSSK